jgi:tRNA A-37 threonylcarbamoyl transferase component Bud32
MSRHDAIHPAAAELLAFHLGQVDDGELARLAAHLDGCVACCALLDQLHARDALLRALRTAAGAGTATPEDAAERRRAVLAYLDGRRRSVAPHTATACTEPASGDAPLPQARPDVPREGPSAAHEEGTPGSRQIGDYEVLAEAGRGGMGVVYKARHLRLGRLAALKMMLAWDHASPVERTRFRLEAELVARLQHPNVVQLYEVGNHREQPFLAMEWVEGDRLADRLHGRPWPAPAAAGLVETLARAVHAAHCQGVIHRDLKPANVLLAAGGLAAGAKPQAAYGVPKITDFGLARPVEGCRGLTRTDYLVGTPEYMAPEQAEGRHAVIGPAVDTYALGVMLYELLTGRLPFHGATPMQVLQAVTSREPPPLRRVRPGVPHDLEAVCLKCLEKMPDRRYGSAWELAEDLERFRQGRPVAARPVGRPARLARWCRRNSGTASLVAALALVSVASFFLVTWKWLDAEQQREYAEDTARREARARAEAEHHRQEARRNLYVANVCLARRAWEEGRVDIMLPLLEEAARRRPEDADLRGFEWYYLRRLARREGLSLRGHSDAVRGVALGPDGRRLAPAGSDQTVRIRHTARSSGSRKSLPSRRHPRGVPARPAASARTLR